MAEAQCSCGALALSLPDRPRVVIACHCIDCQRRTGAPFSAGAYFAVDEVTISGEAKPYTRAAASGGKVHNYFCGNCGSTVYWRLDNLPGIMGVAVGAMANPEYPAPNRSVFERSKHGWVQFDDTVERFRQGSMTKPAD